MVPQSCLKRYNVCNSNIRAVFVEALNRVWPLVNGCASTVLQFAMTPDEQACGIVRRTWTPRKLPTVIPTLLRPQAIRIHSSMPSIFVADPPWPLPSRHAIDVCPVPWSSLLPPPFHSFSELSESPRFLPPSILPSFLIALLVDFLIAPKRFSWSDFLLLFDVSAGLPSLDCLLMRDLDFLLSRSLRLPGPRCPPGCRRLSASPPDSCNQYGSIRIAGGNDNNGDYYGDFRGEDRLRCDILLSMKTWKAVNFRHEIRCRASPLGAEPIKHYSTAMKRCRLRALATAALLYLIELLFICTVPSHTLPQVSRMIRAYSGERKRRAG